ncbi:MAG: MJ1477/TM1410 family putative glycoside hydrolase [Candidatus Heimdallarchaeaceae archaeon]
MKKGIWSVLIIVGIITAGTSAYFLLYYDNNIEIPPPPNFYVNGFLVNDFAYQLQNIDIDEISQSKFDFVILDYSADGSEETEFTAAQVQKMKEGEEKKIVVSYMSIGEAETYRFYWDPTWDADNDGIPDEGAPGWLDVENPDWEGNYKVKYWDPDWQSIIFGSNYSYLDRIINAGFDGCYLDIIDAFEYYEESYPSAKQEMIDFVISLSEYAKSKNENFLVIPQNGEILLEDENYRNAIDGIGREDVYFLDNTQRDSYIIDEIVDLLHLLTNEGKLVMIIDYPTLHSRVVQFYSFAYEDGFLAYAPPRALDKLVSYDDFPPD